MKTGLPGIPAFACELASLLSETYQRPVSGTNPASGRQASP
jgi:hypothetical protein